MTQATTPSLPNLLTQAEAAELARALTAAGYTVDAVLDRIGEAGQAGLTRNSTVAAKVALADQDDDLAVLIRLFVLQQALSEVTALRPFGRQLFGAMVQAGIIEPTGALDKVRAGIDIRPFGSQDDGASGWAVSDLTPGLDQRVSPMRPEYVLGLSPASTTLAQLVMPGRVGRALDLGTGCGIQSLHLAKRADQVVATDLNPRAIQHAQLTFALNGVDVDLRTGSLYEPVADDRFDLIVTNPPYVMSPPDHGERLVYREGGFTGDGLVEQVIRHAPDRLNPGGSLQVLGNWAQLKGVDDAERLASWVAGSGCDLWVIEREKLDIFEYIEMWLTDAGLAQSRHWGTRYTEWLDYFDHLGIEAVSMGWITLTKAEREQPDVRIEAWPWQVEQPVGSALADHRRDVDNAQLDEQALLDTAWTLRADVTQETLGRPGAADVEHIVLRQTSGLRRAIEADTALAAVLGASDGELTAGQIIDAVAQLLEVDADQLRPQMIAKLRTGLADGFLS